jgi:hypothetical protein
MFIFPLSPLQSFLARTTLDDVARSEDRTFICTQKQEDAGPTYNWSPFFFPPSSNLLFCHCLPALV